MSESNDNRVSMAGCGLWLLLLPLVFLSTLYVLGIGPANWLGNEVPETQEFIVAFYAPIGYLASLCGPVERALEWYVEFWI